MNTKNNVSPAIAGFVDWFGERWVVNRSAERAPESGGGAAFARTATCIASCPPSIHDKLHVNVSALPVHLDFRASPRVPSGLDKWCVGFDDVHSHYRWHSSWMDPSGVAHHSSIWNSTTTSVAALRAGLRAAANANNHAMTRAYCLEVLKWGGVYGAVGFIKHVSTIGMLPAYLKAMAQHFNVGAQTTTGLTAATVKRFDSGMTKIHSIFDVNWSPIYDSRVGAAIAMLFELYYADTGAARIAGLEFPSGAARGFQIRDPGQLVGLQHAPQLHTSAVPPHVWAQYQVKLAWVIEELLTRFPTLFSGLGSIASRAHAFEATLFMLGYDLRCFIPAMRCLGLPSIQVEGPAVDGRRLLRGRTWVPTGISMPRVAHLFLAYATTSGFTDLSRAGFITWQVGQGSNRNTASANSSVLQPLELDLCDRTEAEIRCICGGGEDGLLAAMEGRSPPVDERERVYLVATLLLGTLRRRGLDRRGMLAEIIAQGLAHSEGSAGTLISVGTSVGKFFELLDSDGEPTPFFDTFIGGPEWGDLLGELLPQPDAD